MTPPLTPDHLAELRRLAEEATPGPWDVAGNGVSIGSATVNPIADTGYPTPAAVADAAYIVALVNAAPALLEAARREARVRTALERLTRRHTDRIDQTERVTHGPAWGHVAGDPACFICAALQETP